jgi:hypothetical protein
MGEVVRQELGWRCWANQVGSFIGLIAFPALNFSQVNNIKKDPSRKTWGLFSLLV